MGPINTWSPASAARSYISVLGWSVRLGHRHRPRQGCTCGNPVCETPGAHSTDDELRPLEFGDVEATLESAPGAAIIAATDCFDAVIVPVRIAMAALVSLEREAPVPCLTIHGQQAVLLVLPATGRYSAGRPDMQVRTGAGSWVALPPSHGVRWDTPPWNEQTNKPLPLLHGSDVGRHLAEAFALVDGEQVVAELPQTAEAVR